MKKEFKTGDKVFYMETEQYGTFVDYSIYKENMAIVNLFCDNNSEEETFISLSHLKKAETKKVEIEGDKIHYEVFYKVYIDNKKILERAKKEIFKTKHEAIDYLETKRYDYGVNWIEGNIIEVKSKEIFTL